MKIYSLIYFLTFTLILCSCNQKSDELELSLNEKFKFDSINYQNAIKDLTVTGNFEFIKNDSSIFYLDTLTKFYSARNFKPVFIKSYEEQDFLYSLLISFNNVKEHGLSPELYHYSTISEAYIKTMYDSLDSNQRLKGLAEIEFLVTDAILKYSYHMRYGVLNPRELYPDSYFLPITDISNRNLFEPLEQDSIILYLKKIEPNSERYKKLQSALKHFGKYEDEEWVSIPVTDKKIEVGQKDSSLVLILEKLITLGFLDTTETHLNNFMFYDSLLAEPIKKFQRVNGLNDDGIIGKNTIEKLNVTAAEYIRKIKINLERFRWIDYSDSSHYLLVNIPDFMLYIQENGKTLVKTKVCTGRKRPSNYEKKLQIYKKTKNWREKPEDWETPIMYGEISYLVLNPTWNVPQSIMREEIATKITEDSSYLESRNFKVYIDTLEISLEEFELNELYSDTIPYRIVQDPGVGNALGKIKFMFYNPFGIYLHDTPTRSPFNYSNRAVSHGCVRVEKPLQVAEYLLKDHPKWNIDYLKIEIGQRVDDKSKITEYKQKRKSLRRNSRDDKTTELVLSRKTPLYIDYFTAWVDENGITNFRDDVYGKDEVLREQLFSEK